MTEAPASPVVRMTGQADVCHIVDYPQGLIQFYPLKREMDAEPCFPLLSSERVSE